MSQLVPTSSSVTTVSGRKDDVWSTTSSLTDPTADGGMASRLLLEARRVGAKAGRIPDRAAIEAAQRFARQLDELALLPSRVTVSRESTLVFSWIREAKIASLECDADEDRILTLDNRAAGDEAEAVDVTHRAAEYVRDTLARFFERP